MFHAPKSISISALEADYFQRAKHGRVDRKAHRVRDERRK